MKGQNFRIFDCKIIYDSQIVNHSNVGHTYTHKKKYGLFIVMVSAVS